MSLRNVNLNLLPILRALLKTKSVSRAAAALYLSQPTVSDALARLRVLLNDELLVRIGSGMKLTPRATELLEPLESICNQMESFLHSTEFDPARETRQLVIASSDICAYLLVRGFLELLRAEAPGMSLHVIDIDSNLTARMAAREIDFALLPEFAVADLAPAPLRFLPLVPVDHVILMSSTHPLAAKTVITPEDLLQYPHVRFSPDAVITDPKRLTPPWRGYDYRVEARVGQMLLIPHLLIDSTSIAFPTRQLAEDMAERFPLVTRKMPFADAARPFGLVWSPLYDNDPIHKWFRESMLARARKPAATHSETP
jgi:DNA-binding transcriptional LysR family regulator